VTDTVARLCVCFILLSLSAAATKAQRLKAEKVPCLGNQSCYKLSNGTVEVVVTTEVGPRIMRYGFVGADNLLAELPVDPPGAKADTFKVWGGHRLWAAPESMPRTYTPDNRPVEVKLDTNSIRLMAPVEAQTGIQKEMIVTLDAEGTGVTVLHRITNRHPWAVELAPWGLTIMNAGGVAIMPQEPFRPHDGNALVPVRTMALWAYTNLSDPRWTVGEKFIRLRSEAAHKESQKLGAANRQGWMAYHRAGTLFVKRFDYKDGATYPDMGSNAELYSKGTFIEIETLAPLERLEQNAAAEHIERWFLFRDVKMGATDESMEQTLAPLIKQTSLK